MHFSPLIKFAYNFMGAESIINSLISVKSNSIAILMILINIFINYSDSNHFLKSYIVSFDGT